MKLAISSFRSFKQDERGGVAITFAAVLVPVLCSFGVAIDYSRAAAARTALQASLDSATLNSVRNAGTMNAADLQEVVYKSFQSTFKRDELTNVVVTSQYDPAARTLTVNGSGTLKTQMMNIAGLQTMQIATLAKAATSAEPSACVIVLEPSAQRAMSVTGNGTLNVPNCGLQVNSTATIALEQKGSGSVKAKSIKVAGGSMGSFTPPPQERQPVINDPLSTVPEPTVPGACTYTNKTFSVVETLPGGSVYCGDTNFDGSLTFGPGIHYFKNARVAVGSSGSIVGDKVMLYFDADSTLVSSSSGTFKITAMSDWPYAGIAVFSSRAGTSTRQFRFRGSQQYFVNGTIYLPNAHLNLLGTTDVTVTAKSGYVIARSFSYSGDSSFTFDAHSGIVPAGFGAVKPILTQ